MKVYILTCNQFGDGGQIHSVYSSMNAAKAQIDLLCTPEDISFERYNTFHWDEKNYLSYEDWVETTMCWAYNKNMFAVTQMDIQ